MKATIDYSTFFSSFVFIDKSKTETPINPAEAFRMMRGDAAIFTAAAKNELMNNG